MPARRRLKEGAPILGKCSTIVRTSRLEFVSKASDLVDEFADDLGPHGRVAAELGRVVERSQSGLRQRPSIHYGNICSMRA